MCKSFIHSVNAIKNIMNKICILVSLLLGVVYLTYSDNIGDEDIRCTDASCKDVTCDDIPTKCKRNITNPGTFMLSPDICNCCEYCLENLAENEACSVGDPSNGRHTSICGPGLTCIPTKDGQPDGTCQKLTTTCTALQTDYDTRKAAGTVGLMETRPECDDDGLFGTYKCIPGEICYCINSTGYRIFGEADYSTIQNYLTCDCSRKYYDAVSLVGRELGPHEHFRCTPNGDYDRLQCINEKCLCVDSSDGAPTYPNNKLVNITENSKATLPCYKSSTKGQYYKKCESEYMKIHKIVQQLKNESFDGIIGYDYPNCDLDGSFAPVQKNNTHKFCVTTEGKVLTAVELSDSSADAMDCKCVRANLITSTINKPVCLPNGNYKPVQCRRGVCRCVDSNGNQVCNLKGVCEYDESQADSIKC